MIPIGPVDDRVQANAPERNTTFYHSRALIGHEPNPGGPVDAGMTCFGEGDGAFVTTVGFEEQTSEGSPARIVAFVQAGQKLVRWYYPLVVVIIIEPKNV